MSVDTKSGHTLDLGDPTQVPVSVDFAPQASLVQLLVTAAAPVPAGRAPHAIRRSLGPSDSFAVSSFSDARVRQLPDVVMPLAPGSRASVEDQVDALRSTPGDVLTKECLDMWGADVPAVWRPALEQPERWLESFANACARAWKTYRPWWRQSYPALRREARRIGLATVMGQTDVLLGQLHPRIRLEGRRLRFTGACDGGSSLGSRRLVLVPMVSSTSGIIASWEDPNCAYICYALARPSHATETGDSLALLLGPVRAAILRSTRYPQSVSALASRLKCAPSTITYHCDQLVAAGLVVRERRGPATLIGVTEKATELEELTAAYPDWV